MEKRSHLGMAGHYAAMAEFLYRGYNVAVPAVDVGDDVYVVEDQQGTMWRLQVKTSDELTTSDGGTTTHRLSRRQLREVKPNELYFMFVVRWQSRWRFVLIGRAQLAELRDAFEARARKGPGRPALADAEATTDALILRIRWDGDQAEAWNTSLTPYLDRWPDAFPINPDGPGASAERSPSPDR